jgi:hypothetical protein
VTKLEKALYAKWISRFGRAKVKDLADGLKAGRSVSEKSKAVVESKDHKELHALLLEGFDGYFHQTVYLRNLKKAKHSVDAVNSIPVGGKGADSVVLEERTTQATDNEARCLLMVTQSLEFLPTDGPTVTRDIPFPVAVGAGGSGLTVQVLTMQSSVKTWSEILEFELRRLLTPVHADSLYDAALSFLRTSKVDVGDYVDYSSAAIALMKRADVDTYSGSYEFGTVGSTKHDTVRGMGKKQPLRTSMKSKFDELISAERIVNAELELSRNYLGLVAGSKLALYPTIGKIAFRSRLQGHDPDEFVEQMAKV